MVANHSAHLRPSTTICMEESTFHNISTNFANSQQGVLVFSFCYISGGHGMPQVGNMLYSMFSKTSMSTQTNHKGQDKNPKVWEEKPRVKFIRENSLLLLRGLWQAPLLNTMQKDYSMPHASWEWDGIHPPPQHIKLGKVQGSEVFRYSSHQSVLFSFNPAVFICLLWYNMHGTSSKSWIPSKRYV